MFYYLMNLHYSQTESIKAGLPDTFYYLMNLHYSQTSNMRKKNFLKFYYLMNLHYSQTSIEERFVQKSFTTL